MFVKADSLPVLNTSFVGREKELAEIVDLLQKPHCRLLTLTGPGGSGKTRLALEAAGLLQTQFEDGVAFVSLQPVSSPLFIAPTIAEAIGVAVHGPREVQAQMLDYLRERQLLLVLDNFEHLLEAAALVTTMLTVAPRTKVLVTSREVLNLQEEWARPVPGLAVPAPGQTGTADELLAYGAVRLFSERAQQVQRTFSLADLQACVIRICHLVDGLPLALELAASWLRTLTCQEVAAEIERNLDFLETSLRNVPLRHQSMRVVFDQSWRLLTEREQDTFARLSVFHGGCRRDAATAVAGASLVSLQGLVDKSMLMVTDDGRYQSHELLRQFAAEQLAIKRQALEEARDQHMVYFAAFLHRQEPRLRGPGQQDALQKIDADLDNVRVAWMRAVSRRAAEQIRQAMGALFLYYQMRSRLTEGQDGFRAAADLSLSKVEEPLQIRLQLLKTWFDAGVASTPEAAVRFYRESFERLRPLGTDESMAMPLCVFTWAGGLLGNTAPLQRFYAANYAFHQRRGNKWGAAWAAYALGTLPSKMYEETPPADDLADILAYLEESADLLRTLENPWAVTYPLHAAGHILLDLKEYKRAREMFRESLQICRQVGDPGGVAFALHGLGQAATGLQEYEGSWRYLNDALQISYQHRSEMVFTHLYQMAVAFSAAGQPARAVELMAFLKRKSHKKWVRRHASRALVALADLVPEASFAAASRYAELVDLGTLVQTLAAEFGVLDEGPSRVTAVPLAGNAVPMVETLSPRELEVLHLVADGLSNGEIATRLTVTVGTVKKHLNNVFGKLQVTSRTQAVARARALSLLS